MSLDINNISTEWLDRLHCAVWGPHNTPEERQQAKQELTADIERQLWQTISLADFDQSMEFVQYEMAYSQLYMAYTNGKRTADKLSQERDKLQQQMRDDNADTEFGTTAIDRINQRIQALELRYHFWRCFYRAADNVLKSVVDNADPMLAQYMNRDIVKPGGQARRAPTEAWLLEQQRLQRENQRHAA